MEMLESLVGDFEVTNGRHGMTQNLRLLTLKTLSRPSRYIFSHGGPDDF